MSGSGAGAAGRREAMPGSGPGRRPGRRGRPARTGSSPSPPGARMPAGAVSGAPVTSRAQGDDLVFSMIRWAESGNAKR